MKNICFLLTVILFIGCATAKIEHLSQTRNDSNILQGGEHVFIALPKDGSFGEHHYKESGNYVQQYFFDNFLHYTDYVENATKILSLEDAKEEARKQKADILIYPVIVHWEDRNTYWSGLRDKVRINVIVYSLSNDKTLDKSSLYATNSRFTYINARPENRLKTIINPYVKQLYTAKNK